MITRVFAALALLCGTVSVSSAQGQQAYFQTTNQQGAQVAQVGCSSPVCGCESAACATAPSCGMDGGCAGAPACGCEGGCATAPTCGADGGCAAPTCGADMGCASGPSCGCDMGGGCASMGCDGGCDSMCGGGGGCGLGGACDLGDPFSLFPESDCVAVGGWLQMGYHDKALPLFNAHPDRVNLHQAWLYAEKAADGSNGLGLGGRIDYVYGVDAQDTQSFGIDDDHWDNDWDNGIYGHAIPQLYGEAAYGNMSVKVGHFYTIIGWEVVTAPDNFFYSHAYTMYNSEPFTHTGALATMTPSDDLTIYGGYVFGWDSGFKDNGDAFLGGISLAASEDVSITYAVVGGRFATNNDGSTAEEGYMHSLVADVALTDNLQYILQSDLLDSNDGSGATVRNTVGINNYLIYTINDCLAVGGRYEWWNVNADSAGFYGDNAALASSAAVGEYDITALTLGLNYKPHANVIVRPEIRWDWVDGDRAQLAASDISIIEDNDSQTTFGIDSIFLF